MICDNCGEKFESSATFCSQCGQKLAGEDSDQKPVNVASGSTQAKSKIKPKNKFIIVGIAVLILGAFLFYHVPGSKYVGNWIYDKDGSWLKVTRNGSSFVVEESDGRFPAELESGILVIDTSMGKIYSSIDNDTGKMALTYMGSLIGTCTRTSKTSKTFSNSKPHKNIDSKIVGTNLAKTNQTDPAITVNDISQTVENGNTGGNISNHGLACQKGEWIYYSTGDRFSGALYRTKTDGSGRQKLNDDTAEYINVVGDWIYYSKVNGSDYGKLYRTKTDGSGRQKLNDDVSEYINVAGDWAYYMCGNDNCKLYRIKIDGSGRQKLNDNGSSEYINVAGDWVYYSNPGGLFRIKTDGSGYRQLTNDLSPDYINVVGNWVYYCSGKEGYGRKLYRIKTDGSGCQKLNDKDVSNFINVSGGWVYYRNESDGLKLYRIKTDGSGRQKLADSWAGNINVVSDWIYYSDSVKLYRVKIDGSRREEAQ